MSLKSFLSLADDKLHEVFSRKDYDPTKDRAAMVKRLDTAHNQFQSATPTKGAKMFKIANGVVELNLPVALGGKSTFHIPTERFADAIQHLKAAIGAGEADADLKASAEKMANRPGVRMPRAPRQPGEGGGKGWSDERRQRFAASIAARKAAAGK